MDGANKMILIKKQLVAIIVTTLIMCLITGCGSESVAVDPKSSQVEEINEVVDEESNDNEIPVEEVSAADLTMDWRQRELNILSDNYRTYYEIFVYSFCDSDGDGIGDIQGVISKLDYLNDNDNMTDSDLGINGIWLMPIMPSPSYHKYDVTDYQAIDSEYGSLDDIKQLLDECHQRDIKVIIDLAMNHSSSEHPWFKEAVEYLQDLGDKKPDSKICPYFDYYNFTKENQGGYSEVTGTDWYYESRFNYDMPDFNLENEAVRAEFEQIIDFWMELGVDGFRLDAVKHFVTGDDEANIEILTWINDYVKGINQDAYIVCENWSDQTEYARYYESGVDSMFDFAFADKDGIISKSASGKIKASAYGKALQEENDKYSSYSAEYINAPFYTNHDMGRSAGYYSGDQSEAQTKIAEAMNLLMSGSSFLYYGEELGMKGSGRDENKRAPMYWSDEVSYPGLCTGPEQMEDISMKYPSYETQKDDANSIYNYVKDVIRLRNQNPEIARGTTTFEEKASNDALCVISKRYEGKSVYIAYNLSEQEAEIKLDSLSSGPLEYIGALTTSEEKIRYYSDRVALPGYCVLVMRGASEGDTYDMSASDAWPGEELPRYASWEEFCSRNTGSATRIDDRTVVVSLFIDEPECVWTESDKDIIYDICDKAYTGISDILQEKYNVNTDIIYDWKKNTDLAMSIKSNEDIPVYVATTEEEAHIDELEAGWVSQVDVTGLMNKYNADSIAFLYLIPHDGGSYSSMHFVEDGPETWNEGCLLYLQDMYSDTLDYETPTVYAHEFLHLFGAEDLYSVAEVFSKETYDKLNNMCADDIMLHMYDMINGVYTTYHDGVHGTISPVTAYLLGIGDESDVEEVPELLRDEPGCFPGSTHDRPF